MQFKWTCLLILKSKRFKKYYMVSLYHLANKEVNSSQSIQAQTCPSVSHTHWLITGFKGWKHDKKKYYKQACCLETLPIPHNAPVIWSSDLKANQFSQDWHVSTLEHLIPMFVRMVGIWWTQVCCQHISGLLFKHKTAALADQEVICFMTIITAIKHMV